MYLLPLSFHHAKPTNGMHHTGTLSRKTIPFSAACLTPHNDMIPVQVTLLILVWFGPQSETFQPYPLIMRIRLISGL
jgi:hypothetical protein